jgi:hypothetical protein
MFSHRCNPRAMTNNMVRASHPALAKRKDGAPTFQIGKDEGRKAGAPAYGVSVRGERRAKIRHCYETDNSL